MKIMMWLGAISRSIHCGVCRGRLGASSVRTLTDLHAEAYQWTADREQLRAQLYDRLGSLPLDDTRVTLKGLMDEIDQVQQEAFFAS